MKQLVELQKHAEQFSKLETEVIVIFREETGGIKALEKIRERTRSDFTLAVDLEKKTTGMYSKESSAFDNYLITKSGTVVRIFPGKKAVRTTADDVIKAIKDLP